MSDDDPLAGMKLYYDQRASEYDSYYARSGVFDKGPKWNRGFREDLEEVAGYLASSVAGSVLEIGCGTGHWSEILVASERVSRILAIDQSAQMLSILAGELDPSPELSIEEADFLGWPPPEAYDVVFFGFLLSHVPPSLFGRLWGHIRRSLTPSGKAVLIDNAVDEGTTGRRIHGALPHVLRRRLNDGCETGIVKVIYDAADLRRKLAVHGWQAGLRVTRNGHFLHGEAIVRFGRGDGLSAART